MKNSISLVLLTLLLASCSQTQKVKVSEEAVVSEDDSSTKNPKK